MPESGMQLYYTLENPYYVLKPIRLWFAFYVNNSIDIRSKNNGINNWMLLLACYKTKFGGIAHK